MLTEMVKVGPSKHAVNDPKFQKQLEFLRSKYPDIYNEIVTDTNAERTTEFNSRITEVAARLHCGSRISDVAAISDVNPTSIDSSDFGPVSSRISDVGLASSRISDVGHTNINAIDVIGGVFKRAIGTAGSRITSATGKDISDTDDSSSISHVDPISIDSSRISHVDPITTRTRHFIGDSTSQSSEKHYRS